MERFYELSFKFYRRTHPAELIECPTTDCNYCEFVCPGDTENHPYCLLELQHSPPLSVDGAATSFAQISEPMLAVD